MEKVILITAIDRINYFSDNFIKYYLNFFHPDEVFFMVNYVDYNEIVKYLRGYGFSKFEQYQGKSFGEGNNITNQNRIKTQFIQSGYKVVYSDMDERIYHPQLRDIILNTQYDHLVAFGMQIIQKPDEPPLDLTKNVLEQRDWCYPDRQWYSKTCILNKDFHWTPGRHNRLGAPKLIENLYLFDLGRCCKDLMIINNATTNRIYGRVMWRYKELNKAVIERELYNPLMPKLINIPAIVKESNLF